MSAAGTLLGPAPKLFDDRGPQAPPRAPAAHAREDGSPPSGGARLTLERRFENVWEGLRAAGAAECPLCGERMEATAAGGSCRGCGSRLT